MFPELAPAAAGLAAAVVGCRSELTSRRRPIRIHILARCGHVGPIDLSGSIARLTESMPTTVVARASASRRWRRRLRAGWFAGTAPAAARLGTAAIGCRTELRRRRRLVRIHSSRACLRCNHLRTIGAAEVIPTSPGPGAVRRRRWRVLHNTAVCKTGGTPALVRVRLGRRDLNGARPIRLAPTWDRASVLINASRLSADRRLGQCLFS